MRRQREVGMVSGRTRTARGEGDGRDYSEVRARAPNGSQEVAARVRGGHVTARTRVGVQLGRLTRSVGLGRRRVDTTWFAYKLPSSAATFLTPRATPRPI